MLKAYKTFKDHIEYFLKGSLLIEVIFIIIRVPYVFFLYNLLVLSWFFSTNTCKALERPILRLKAIKSKKVSTNYS